MAFKDASYMRNRGWASWGHLAEGQQFVIDYLSQKGIEYEDVPKAHFVRIYKGNKEYRFYYTQNRWAAKGNATYYEAKGIEDFVDRFYNKER